MSTSLPDGRASGRQHSPRERWTRRGTGASGGCAGAGAPELADLAAGADGDGRPRSSSSSSHCSTTRLDRGRRWPADPTACRRARHGSMTLDRADRGLRATPRTIISGHGPAISRTCAIACCRRSAAARTDRCRLLPGAIVVADDLTPSRFLALDWSSLGGAALRARQRLIHVAMLARARGVPMVVGLGRGVRSAAKACSTARRACWSCDPIRPRASAMRAGWTSAGAAHAEAIRPARRARRSPPPASASR